MNTEKQEQQRFKFGTRNPVFVWNWSLKEQESLLCQHPEASISGLFDIQDLAKCKI